MTTIVDYGVGNVMAFANYYRRAGIEARVARTPGELEGADRLILPGVGSFDHAMGELNRSGLRPVLEELVLERKVPVLGVCVGMQMLMEGSEEGVEPGLGWVAGRVRRLAGTAAARAGLPLPHMGWNDVSTRDGAPLFTGLHQGARFYFLHSYFVECVDPAHVTGTVAYGGELCCALSDGHVQGVQFHPEKSHHWGAALLSNFARI